jgi:hypothetical protein
MSLKDRISWEIRSEEDLIDERDRIAPDQLESIIEEVLDYIAETEGYDPDDLIEEDVQVALTQQIIILFYYLRHVSQAS